MGIAALLTALHPPSVLPSFMLPSVTAQMLELNCLVTVKQCVRRVVVSFYQRFQARKGSWLNQAETKQIACPRTRFSQGCFAEDQCQWIQTASLSTDPNSGATSFAQVLTLALSQCIVFSAIFPPPYIRTTLFIFVQIPSSSCGFRKKKIHLHRYHRHFGKPPAWTQINVCDFYWFARSSLLYFSIGLWLSARLASPWQCQNYVLFSFTSLSLTIVYCYVSC